MGTRINSSGDLIDIETGKTLSVGIVQTETKGKSTIGVEHDPVDFFGKLIAYLFFGTIAATYISNYVFALQWSTFKRLFIGVAVVLGALAVWMLFKLVRIILRHPIAFLLNMVALSIPVIGLYLLDEKNPTQENHERMKILGWSDLTPNDLTPEQRTRFSGVESKGKILYSGFALPGSWSAELVIPKSAVEIRSRAFRDVEVSIDGIKSSLAQLSKQQHGKVRFMSPQPFAIPVTVEVFTRQPNANEMIELLPLPFAGNVKRPSL